MKRITTTHVHGYLETAAFGILFLAQDYAHADGGTMASLGEFFLYVIGVVAVLWCIVTGIVFWAVRKLPLATRLATTALVFVSPILALLLSDLADRATRWLRFLDLP